MKRLAIRCTASPPRRRRRAARPARRRAARRATGASGRSTSPRREARWAATSRGPEHAGATSTSRNSAAFRAGSRDSSSIPRSSSARARLRPARAWPAAIRRPSSRTRGSQSEPRRSGHGGGRERASVIAARRYALSRSVTIVTRPEFLRRLFNPGDYARNRVPWRRTARDRRAPRPDPGRGRAADRADRRRHLRHRRRDLRGLAGVLPDGPRRVPDRARATSGPARSSTSGAA